MVNPPPQEIAFHAALLKCSEVTAFWFSSAFDGRFSDSRKAAIAFLAFAAVIEGLVTVLAGDPTAQSPGQLRTHGLICCLLAGLLGVSYWGFMRPSIRFGSNLDWLSVLVPVYAFCQVIPVPLGVVRVLSPARASLVDALQPITSLPRWVPISAIPSATLYHCVLFSACTSLFLVIYDLSKHFAGKPWIVTVPLIAVGAAQAIIGLLQASASADAFATGTYAIRNHYAGFLEMVLPFTALIPFALFVTRKPGTGIQGKLDAVAPTLLACAGFALTALLAAAIVSSLSRMGYIASLISMAFIVITVLARRFLSGKVPFATAMLAVVTMILILLLPSIRLINRFGDLAENGSERSLVWSDTLGVIRTYPIVGCGLGAYESVFLGFKKSNPALYQDYAHNDYLQYLAEMGALGFAIAILPLSAIILRLRIGMRDFRPDIQLLSLACEGSVLAIGIHSLVDFNLYVPANLFTLAWVLGISAYVGEGSLGTEAALFQATVSVPGPTTHVGSSQFR